MRQYKGLFNKEIQWSKVLEDIFLVHLIMKPDNLETLQIESIWESKVRSLPKVTASHELMNLFKFTFTDKIVFQNNKEI